MNFITHNMYETVTERFIRYVNEHNLSKRKLSLELGLAQNTVYHIMGGVHVSSRVLEQIRTLKPEIYEYITFSPSSGSHTVSEATVTYQRSFTGVWGSIEMGCK